MENVLFTNYPSDFRKFAELKMNKSDILAFANEMKKKYDTNEYKLKIYEFMIKI